MRLVLDAVSEEELAGGLDALAATGQDAVTGVEADGAGGSLGGSRNGGSRATLAAAVAEDGVTGATDALSATSEEAVTGVEADGALGGDKGGREGSEEDGELHVDGRFRWWWCGCRLSSCGWRGRWWSTRSWRW